MTLAKEMREATAKDLAFLDNIIKNEQEAPLRSVMHCEYEAMQRISALVRTLLDAPDEGWKRFGDEKPKEYQRVLWCSMTLGDGRDTVRSAAFDAPNRWHCDHASIPAHESNFWRPLPAHPSPEPAEGKRE